MTTRMILYTDLVIAFAIKAFATKPRLISKELFQAKLQTPQVAGPILNNIAETLAKLLHTSRI